MRDGEGRVSGDPSRIAELESHTSFGERGMMCDCLPVNRDQVWSCRFGALTNGCFEGQGPVLTQIAFELQKLLKRMSRVRELKMKHPRSQSFWKRLTKGPESSSWAFLPKLDACAIDGVTGSASHHAENAQGRSSHD
jgi:hypothetical protein